MVGSHRKGGIVSGAWRVLVTGSRHLNDRRLVADVLTSAWSHAGEPTDVVLVHGDCPYGGANLLAEQYATSRGWRVEPVPADWRRIGRAAGPVRNQDMVDRGADLAVAFPAPGSRGTWDCLRRAESAGIPTRVHPVGAAPQ